MTGQPDDRWKAQHYSIENNRYIDTEVGDTLGGKRVMQFYTGKPGTYYVVLERCVNYGDGSESWLEWAVFTVTAGVMHTSLDQVTPWREYSFAQHDYGNLENYVGAVRSQMEG